MLGNVFAGPPESIEVLRYGELEILRIADDADPFLSGRVLDLEHLLEPAGGCPPDGVLFAIPSATVLLLHRIGRGQLDDALAHLVAHVGAEYDEGDDRRGSRWLYWHSGGRYEEFGYDLDDEGDLESVNLPHPRSHLLDRG